LIDKDSLKIKQLGHVLIEKVEQLFLGHALWITWPRDRRKYDREPEHGAKQEQHRRDLGETNRIRVKRRLMELRTWTVHKPQVDFFTFCSLFQFVLATASIP
jgi:hypothetical protein